MVALKVPANSFNGFKTIDAKAADLIMLVAIGRQIKIAFVPVKVVWVDKPFSYFTAGKGVIDNGYGAALINTFP